MQFSDFGLDPLLTTAITRESWSKPTLIQEKCIQAALKGQNVLGRSKTGSGKTGAYVLPLLQSVLRVKKNLMSGGSGSAAAAQVRGVVLVPSTELCEQVTNVIKQLSRYCTKWVSVKNVNKVFEEGNQSKRKQSHNNGKAQQQQQQSNTATITDDILCATPPVLKSLLKRKQVSLQQLTFLVVDEADYIVSLKYNADVHDIQADLPPTCQCMLMSATLSDEVKSVLTLSNPVEVDVDDSLESNGNLQQFSLNNQCSLMDSYPTKFIGGFMLNLAWCKEDDKYLLIYAMFKLENWKGKALVFVNDITKAFRIRLFLEAFGVKSAVLNSELPLNSRTHIIQEFNRGAFNYLIATDEMMDTTSTSTTTDSTSGSGETMKSTDYGVVRGIDFKFVDMVINFDFPLSAKAYTHRIGRTARAGATGQALSFVVTKKEESMLETVIQQQAEKDQQIQSYPFQSDAYNGFRYRVEDVLQSISRSSIKDARLKELKKEILASEQLQAHFKQNPNDLNALSHHRPLHSLVQQPELKHVPSYLLQDVRKDRKKLTQSATLTQSQAQDQRKQAAQLRHQHRQKRKQGDPLQSFSLRSGGGAGAKKKSKPQK